MWDILLNSDDYVSQNSDMAISLISELKSQITNTLS